MLARWYTSAWQGRPEANQSTSVYWRHSSSSSGCASCMPWIWLCWFAIVRLAHLASVPGRPLRASIPSYQHVSSQQLHLHLPFSAHQPYDPLSPGHRSGTTLQDAFAPAHSARDPSGKQQHRPPHSSTTMPSSTSCPRGTSHASISVYDSAASQRYDRPYTSQRAREASSGVRTSTRPT